jgi:hypothetical protein
MTSIGFETLRNGLAILNQDRTDSLVYDRECTNRMLKMFDEAFDRAIQKTRLEALGITVISSPYFPPNRIMFYQVHSDAGMRV